MNPEIPVLFTDSWNTYHKVIESNYMLHREFGAHTLDYLQLQASSGPLKILDLGCGDAGPISKLLSGIAVSSYTGFDLSGVALELCRRNLSVYNFPLFLKEGKMEELLDEDRENYSLIYSSFSIHHLQDDAKRRFLSSIYEHLDGGGRFLFTDIYRQPGMSRKTYFDDYMENVNKTWRSLEPVEKNRIDEHIRNYDFPSFREEQIQWCVEAGFEIEYNPDLDPRHQMLIFKK